MVYEPYLHHLEFPTRLAFHHSYTKYGGNISCLFIANRESEVVIYGIPHPRNDIIASIRIERAPRCFALFFFVSFVSSLLVLNYSKNEVVLYRDCSDCTCCSSRSSLWMLIFDHSTSGPCRRTWQYALCASASHCRRKCVQRYNDR